MTNDLQGFDRLVEIVGDLNEATERINKYLQAFELKLKEISPGVAVLVHYKHDKEQHTSYGYAKTADGWHLCVKEGDNQPVTIHQAARYHRLRLFKLRQAILDGLIELSKSTTVRMNKAIQGLPETDETE